MNLERFLNLSVLYFPQIEIGNNNGTFRIIKRNKCECIMKCLEQCLAQNWCYPC